MLNRIVSIFSILSVVYSYAQNKVELEISPANVEVGETFSVTVKSTVMGELKFDQVPSSFVQDYNIHHGSSSEKDYNSNTYRVVYFYSFTGIITKEGKYNFGPAFITSGNQAYSSNEATIVVGKKVSMILGKVTPKQLKNPAFGMIQVNKQTIYEGEPLLVSAKIYASYLPSHVGLYKSYSIPGTTIKHPIGNTTSFKPVIEKYRGIEYYTGTYDKNVIFPSGVGKFKIDPFTLNLHQGYQNFPIVSNEFTIDILPLPANPPADFIGAVGDFSVARKIDTKELKQGDVIKMVITVSGLGNLQNIIEPSLNLPDGCTVYGDPLIKENFTVGIYGTEGEISYEYNIEVKKAGDISLPATTISFFDPSKEKYLQATTDEIPISVERDKNYIVQEEVPNASKDTELVIHNSKIKGERELINQDSFYNTPGFWGGVGTPIFASLLFIFFARRRDKSEDKAIIKRQKAAKDSAFNERLSIAKSMVSTGTDSEFYTEIENALRKAFEIEMNFQEDRLITKSDIRRFIDQSNKNELNKTVDAIFSNCEQFKYGFSSTDTSREEILNELKVVISELNQVKW